jgi:predicted RNA-binding protein with PUA-like domain
MYPGVMARRWWLVKSEPSEYSWHDLARSRYGVWDGVRNVTACNHLRSMTHGDLVLVYHTGQNNREILGVAQVMKEAYRDPTARAGDWSAVDLAPLAPLKAPVSLAQIKQDPELGGMLILRRPRLSVAPVSEREFSRVLELGQITLAGVPAATPVGG